MKGKVFIVLVLSLSFFMTSCGTFLVNKLAFYPEKVPADRPVIDHARISELFIESSDATKFHAFYFSSPGAKKVVLYLHGNAGNAYHRLDDANAVFQMGCNVLLIDYRGYGKSEGSPSEKGIYRDALAAYKFLKEKKGFTDQDIFVFGRSIGTTAAIEISQKKDIAGLILVSPLSTGKDMARQMAPGFLAWLVGSSFDNVGKAKNIACPVLIIHGEKDKVIPISQGRQVFEVLSSSKKQFQMCPGVGHNDIIQLQGKLFWSWIEEFISESETREREGPRS